MYKTQIVYYKIALYSILLKQANTPNGLTTNEIDIAFYLASDKDIQDKLNSGAFRGSVSETRTEKNQ